MLVRAAPGGDGWRAGDIVGGGAARVGFMARASAGRGLVPSEQDSVTAAGSVARVCVVAVPRQSRAPGPWASPLLSSADS